MNKAIAVTALSMSLSAAATAFLQDAAKPAIPMPISMADIQAVSPALGRYSRETLLGEVWKRPAMSPRDRSLVTVVALIARDQTVEMPFYFELALDSGVTPTELSEIINHRLA